MLETSHRKFWTSPRTPSCKNYENEILKWPPSSNFISHSESCRSIPLGKTWEVYQNPDGALGEVATVAKGSGLIAQHSMMEDFSAWGLANPAKTVTQKGFCKHLVMGLVEDDLPYSIGEKQGMWKLFEYLVSQMCCCSFSPNRSTWYRLVACGSQHQVEREASGKLCGPCWC